MRENDYENNEIMKKLGRNLMLDHDFRKATKTQSSVNSQMKNHEN